MLATIVAPALESPLTASEVEVDEFQYVYGPGKPSIADDTITLPFKHVNDHVIKLSISHALAQAGGRWGRRVGGAGGPRH